MWCLQKYTIVSAKIQVPTVLMPRDTKTIHLFKLNYPFKSVLGKQIYEGLCVANKLLVFAFFRQRECNFLKE